MVHARDEALRQPQLNLRIAQTYLTAADGQMAKRTWGDVMREMIALRTGANAARYERSAAESAFDAIRDRRLIDTQAEQYGLSLSAAFSGSTLVPLFSGLLAAGLLAGLLPAMRCYRRSLSDGLSPEVES